MSYGITISSILLFINMLVAGMIAFYTWKRRAMHGAHYLFILMLSIIIWSLAGAFEDMAFNYYEKILWSKISYFGIASAAPAWFLFTLYYRYENKIDNRLLAVIWAFPVAVIISAFTNEYHHQVWPTIVWGPAEIGHRLVYSHGPIKLALAVYSYVLLILGTAFLVKSVKSFHKLFRTQFYAIIIAAIAPWAGNITYLTGVTPAWIDTTPLFFSVTGIFITWGLTRFHILDIAPIAYDTLFINMSDGVLVLDTENKIVNINPAAKQFFNIQDDMLGSHISKIQAISNEIIERLNNVYDGRVELNIQNNQQFRWTDIRISKLLNHLGQPRGRLFVVRDITERKHLEDELTHYATTDALTGVFNRRMGLVMLEKQLKLMQRLGAPLSICFADINGLKDVNDRFGHDEGDCLITMATEAMRTSQRELDSIARIGGDEFLMILPQCTGEQADLLISRIEELLKKINFSSGKLYDISISFGIAEYLPGSKESADELIFRADAAMYIDKKMRKNLKPLQQVKL